MRVRAHTDSCPPALVLQSGRLGCAAAWPCHATREPPNWPTSQSKPKTCGRSPASPSSSSRSWGMGSSGKSGWVGPGGQARARDGGAWGYPQAWHPTRKSSCLPGQAEGHQFAGMRNYPMPCSGFTMGTPGCPMSPLHGQADPHCRWNHKTRPGGPTFVILFLWHPLLPPLMHAAFIPSHPLPPPPCLPPIPRRVQRRVVPSAHPPMPCCEAPDPGIS